MTNKVALEVGTLVSRHDARVKGQFRRADYALFVLLAILSIFIVGCGAGRDKGEGGDVDRGLRVTLTSDIRGTNPGVNRDANTDTVMAHILEGLVAYKEDGSTGLLLAESLKVSEDGKTYTFKLREGLKFHNGAPVTAEDVVWSWKRYLDPATGWTCLGDFDGSKGRKLEAVEAIDPNTVEFRLNQPQPQFLSSIAAIQCGGGAILHPSSVDEKGQWRWPVATGPYRLVDWRRGHSVQVEAFPNYSPRSEPRSGNTGAKLALERTITWLVIRDAASRMAALQSGQIDVMPEVPAVEVQQLKHIKGVKLVESPMLGAYGILIQDHDPLLSDLRIRQAIALSIDREALANLVNEGTAKANPSIVATASKFHPSDSVLGGHYDLEHAKSLLEEAGYDGAPITLTTNRRYPAMYNQALLVQAMCRRVGINIKIEILEWAAQMDRWHAGRFQLFSFGFSAKADPADSYDSILGDRTKNPSKVWDNPQALALLKQSLTLDDFSQRKAVFDQIHELMLQDIPYIGLFSPADINAVRTNVQGFQSWAFGRARYWGVVREKGKTP